MKYPGFVGPAYQLAERKAEVQECINLYPSKLESTGEWILESTPGLELWVAGHDPAFAGHASGPHRAMLQTDTDLYYVIGAEFYKVTPGGLRVHMGSVGTDAGNSPAYIHTNGNQLLIASAGNLYVDNGVSLSGPLTFAAPTGVVDITFSGIASRVDWVSGDKFSSKYAGKKIDLGGTLYPVLSVESSTRLYLQASPANASGVAYTFPTPATVLTSTYLDGYGIFNPPNSREFYISRLLDFSTFDGLDVGVKEGYPDHIARVIAHDRHLYLLGYETAEIWAHTGAADFPFERVNGGVMPLGCGARWAACGLSSGLGVIGRKDGGLAAYVIQGMRPVKVSTMAIDAEWSTYANSHNATAYTYAENGREFWVITFDTANKTWVYDVTAGQWHRRAYGTDRQLGITHAYWTAQQKRIVGSRLNSNLYYMGKGYISDAGTAIQRTRVAPHISNNDGLLFHRRLQVLMQMGEKTGGGSGTLTMQYSDDGGQTWSSAKTASTGVALDRKIRAIWRRLGKSRDRIYRVVVTDAQKLTITGADLDLAGV